MRNLSFRCLLGLTSLALASALPAALAGDPPKDHVSQLREALRAAPDNGGVMWELAKAEAKAGSTTEALLWIGRVLDQGLDVDIEDPAFQSLEGKKEFTKLTIRAAANRVTPRGSTVLFTIPEKDLIPEGIAYDPVEDAYFLGSIHKKKIVRVGRDGRAEDFTSSGQDGLWDVLGLRVQAAQRKLWAASRAGASAGPDAGKCGLFVYDLGTRKLIRKLILDDPSGKHLLNDIAVTPNGEAFVTDSDFGAVWRVRTATDVFEPLVPAGTFIYPNGIALAPDGATLFVADFSRGISRVDIAGGSVTPLAHPATISLTGVDGLYMDTDGLVAVQNDIPLPRVVRYALSPGMDRVVSVRILEARHPLFAIPTTGALVGDFLALLATSHLDALTPSGPLAPDATLGDVVVLKVPLK